MDKFQIIKNCGDGTYGTVVEAINKTTRETVAIKKMKRKFESWDEAMSLREVRTLRKLNHANVVKLKEVIRVQDSVYLVFEYMSGTILDHMREQKRFRGANGLALDQIKSIMKQLMIALAFVHFRGYFHRDLKPENLLYQDGKLKVADFGLSKEWGISKNHTNYVSTRWYRAPEIMLRQKNYETTIDIFAAGCIFAELFTGDPLIPGTSETDMLHRLSRLIGCVPTKWQKGFDLAAGIGLTNLPGCLIEPNKDQIMKNLQNTMPAAPQDALDLISRMISWNPKDRPSATECLKHSFFGFKEKQSGRQDVAAPQYELHRYKDQTLRRLALNDREESQLQPTATKVGPLVTHGRSQNPSIVGNNYENIDTTLDRFTVKNLGGQIQNRKSVINFSSDKQLENQPFTKSNGLRQFRDSQQSMKRAPKHPQKLSINGNNIVFSYQGNGQIEGSGIPQDNSTTSLTQRFVRNQSHASSQSVYQGQEPNMNQGNSTRISNNPSQGSQRRVAEPAAYYPSSLSQANQSSSNASVGDRMRKPHLFNKQIFAVQSAITQQHYQQNQQFNSAGFGQSHHSSMETLSTGLPQRQLLPHRATIIPQQQQYQLDFSLNGKLNPQNNNTKTQRKEYGVPVRPVEVAKNSRLEYTQPTRNQQNRFNSFSNQKSNDQNNGVTHQPQFNVNPQIQSNDYSGEELWHKPNQNVVDQGAKQQQPRMHTFAINRGSSTMKNQNQNGPVVLAVQTNVTNTASGGFPWLNGTSK